MSSGKRPFRIVIVNQHGENRGDEAAMRAMLDTFVELLGDVEFTLLYQFRDRSLRLRFRHKVQDFPIIMPPQEALALVLYGLGARAGARSSMLWRGVPGEIVEAYRDADLIVSAPGGPYFGDIYANHEIVHWYFIWLAKAFRKPIFLYATSAGPFENRLLNPIRRALFPYFDILCVREEISAEYLRNFLGPKRRIEITADSALQTALPPLPRDEYFAGRSGDPASRYLVGVSLNDYKYPGSQDADRLRRHYDQTMIELLSHVARQQDAHFLFVPQLYGKVHSDAPYLERMARQLPAGTSYEMVDPAADSDMQRRIFAMCDIHVASRYHPAIFGHSGGVPGVCIYYEHKALGFMSQLGLERFAFDIRNLELGALTHAVDEVMARRDALSAQIAERIPALREKARRTAQLAVSLIDRRV